MEQRMEMTGGGTLMLRQEGGRVHLEAERSGCTDGLYKVWLRGAQGQRCLLGTLVPEQGRYVLRRTVAVRELTAAGCWPPAAADAVCAFVFTGNSGWYREQNPERFIADRLLHRQISGPVLCRREGECIRFAVPFRRDRPLPLSGLFCLACVEQVEGRPHLIWSFDREGNPVLPHSGGDSGQTKDSRGD